MARKKTLALNPTILDNIEFAYVACVRLHLDNVVGSDKELKRMISALTHLARESAKATQALKETLRAKTEKAN
jgi:hypothetical protein